MVGRRTYPRMEDFFADLAKAYQMEIGLLAERARIKLHHLLFILFTLMLAGPVLLLQQLGNLLFQHILLSPLNAPFRPFLQLIPNDT